MDTSADELTKVHLDLPNHWWFKGESLWAKSLGDDLYEIQNVPFCAYGLNCGDVVHATADAPDLAPEVRSVVRRSGSKTLRVFFMHEPPDKKVQQPYLDALQKMGSWVERANANVVCVNVEPTADYEAIRNHLARLEAEQVLEYETCEERIAGSFDDAPEPEDDEDPPVAS